MQNKRLLIPTIAALIISISCFFYLKYSMNQLEKEKVETIIEESDHEENDVIGLGFTDLDFIQRIGSTFRFFTTLK